MTSRPKRWWIDCGSIRNRFSEFFSFPECHIFTLNYYLFIIVSAIISTYAFIGRSREKKKEEEIRLYRLPRPIPCKQVFVPGMNECVHQDHSTENEKFIASNNIKNTNTILNGNRTKTNKLKKQMNKRNINDLFCKRNTIKLFSILFEAI